MYDWPKILEPYVAPQSKFSRLILKHHYLKTKLFYFCIFKKALSLTVVHLLCVDSVNHTCHFILTYRQAQLVILGHIGTYFTLVLTHMVPWGKVIPQAVCIYVRFTVCTRTFSISLPPLFYQGNTLSLPMILPLPMTVQPR